jgi:hypothetical protein
MSKEYFEKIKMNRGDVNTSMYDKTRNWDYFKNNDYKEFVDDELANLLE